MWTGADVSPTLQQAAAGSSDSTEQPEADPLAGTWEKLYLEDDDALVERRDVWVRTCAI